MALSDTQKTNIVNHVRTLQAKKLKKARKLFREGIDKLATMSEYDLRNMEIDKETITVFITDKVNLEEVQAIIDKTDSTLQDSYNRKYGKAYINLEIQEPSCFEYIEESSEDYTPVLQVVYDEYTFRPVKYLRKRMRGSRKQILIDAVFKVAHQPNGKDTKKYLKWAEG